MVAWQVFGSPEPVLRVSGNINTGILCSVHYSLQKHCFSRGVRLENAVKSVPEIFRQALGLYGMQLDTLGLPAAFQGILTRRF